MPSPTTPVKAVKVDENARKLIVVLEQACLETFKVSVNGKEDKYMLLNADDHVRAAPCVDLAKFLFVRIVARDFGKDEQRSRYCQT
jgi:hypothetical protein